MKPMRTCDKPIILSVFIAFSIGFSAAQSPKPMPPQTRQDNIREVINGVEITDPYRWLEDQDSVETRKWN
jgi:prolyl oligopeptidase